MKDIIKDRIEKIENNIVPQGYKKTEIGIIPEDWKVEKLGEVSDVKGGKRIPKGHFLQDKKSENPYITVADMEDYTINKKNIKYVPEEVVDLIKKYTVDSGDIIISVAGTIGKISYIPESLDGANLTENADKFINIKSNKNYFFYILKSNYIQEEINKEKTLNAQPKLALTRIRNFKLPIPQLKEQEKIASILSTWDQYIENIDSIIESKKKQKKGLMQNLLTGEVRLPGFKGEWKEVKLGDVTKIVTGTTPSTKQSNYFGGDYPWITPTDITDLKYIYDSERKLSTKGIEKGRFIPKDSLLITCIASIGKNSILKVDGSCNQQINALYPSKKHSNEFFYYLLTYKKKYMESFAGKTATKILNKKSFESLKFLIPIFDEQVAIASVLSSADREIELLEDLRNKRMEEKKGLMQLLLTGIVRVGG